jgi:hypothetical protein
LEMKKMFKCSLPVEYQIKERIKFVEWVFDLFTLNFHEIFIGIFLLRFSGKNKGINRLFLDSENWLIYHENGLILNKKINQFFKPRGYH